MSYTDLAAALARCKERAGAPNTADSYLTELLQQSAGVDSQGTTHYRVFYCAAKWLEQDLAGQRLSEAEGVKFTGQVTPIASFLGMQRAYDLSEGLTVPAGYEAIVKSQSRVLGSVSVGSDIHP